MKRFLLIAVILLISTTAHAEGSFTLNEVSFIYTAPTASLLSVVGDAAHNIYGWNKTTFNTLTNQQKVNIIDDDIKARILREAKEYRTKVKAAAEAVITNATYTMQ